MQIYDIPIDENDRETTRHGSDAFPLAVYQTQLSKNVLGYVNWHWHEELQLCRVVAGCICVRTRQAQHVLCQGQGIFLHANTLHSIVPVAGTDGTYVCIDVHPNFLGTAPESIIVQRYIAPFLQPDRLHTRVFSQKTPDGQVILPLMDTVDRLYRAKPPGYEWEIWMALLGIWKQLTTMECTDAVAPDAVDQHDDVRLRTLLTLMQQRYGEKLSLRDFADAVHLCESECCRFFKQAMGCTLFAHLLQVRIEKSIPRLLHTDLSISRIAYDCGFGSTSYFIQRFRQRLGQTPLAFRKAARGVRDEKRRSAQMESDAAADAARMAGEQGPAGSK